MCAVLRRTYSMDQSHHRDTDGHSTDLKDVHVLCKYQCVVCGLQHSLRLPWWRTVVSCLLNFQARGLSIFGCRPMFTSCIRKSVPYSEAVTNLRIFNGVLFSYKPRSRSLPWQITNDFFPTTKEPTYN